MILCRRIRVKKEIRPQIATVSQLTLTSLSQLSFQIVAVAVFHIMMIKGKIKQFPYSNRKNLTRQTWTKQGPNFSLQKYQCYFILIPNLQNYVQKSGNCSFRDLCRNFIEAAPLLPAIREEYNQCTEPPPEYEWVWMKLEETFRLYLTNDQTSRGQTIWARTEINQ